MLISVIVPFYNSEQWLGRCLASLTMQAGDFEFLIVDDHSTDKSIEVAYEYCNHDSRSRLLTNNSGKGVSGARNTGIDCASGTWVTFLDADDEMLANAHLTFRRIIERDSRANIHQLNHMRYYTAIDKLVLKYANYGGVYGFGKLPDMWFGVWNKLYRADFIKDIRFDEDLQYGEDGLFNIMCLIKDNYIHHAQLDEVAVKHRFDNKESLSHIKTADDIFKYIKKYEEVYEGLTAFYEDEAVDVMRKELCGIIGDLWSVRMVKTICNT